MGYRTSAESSLERLERLAGLIPADLVAVVGFVGITAAVFSVPALAASPLRPLVGLAFAMFLPGYTLVAVAIPWSAERPTGVERMAATRMRRDIDWLERIVLSFGASLAVVPLVGLVTTVAGLPISALPTVIGGLVVLGVVAAAIRRARLPAESRLEFPFRRWLGSIRQGLFGSGGVDSAVNVLLAVSVLLAIVPIGYALAVPNAQESYSNLYLATENESGERVAGNYPETFTAGQSEQLLVGVENAEGESVSYTVVVELQRVQADEDAVSVLETEPLGQFRTTLDAGESWERQHAVEPTMTGTDLRLQYYLYKGSAPSDPDAESAYRHVYIWIDVESADA